MCRKVFEPDIQEMLLKLKKDRKGDVYENIAHILCIDHLRLKQKRENYEELVKELVICMVQLRQIVYLAPY